MTVPQPPRIISPYAISPFLLSIRPLASVSTHITYSMPSDMLSVRALLVSINLFNLLCDGLGNRTSKPYSNVLQFGGPILYMIVQTMFAFAVLVYVDSGSPIPGFLRGRRNKTSTFAVEAPTMVDVMEEEQRLERGTGDALQIQRLKKRFAGAPTIAVNDVSFGVSEGETFALIGPNGAGKTTTLACIRGTASSRDGDLRMRLMGTPGSSNGRGCEGFGTLYCQGSKCCVSFVPLISPLDSADMDLGDRTSAFALKPMLSTGISLVRAPSVELLYLF